ncbi:MAG: hypothetical protein ACD_73C00488G0001 [uncultured bacterium]|nr:MAG: hypothetical protein ACD_73C00488G0001 [uncultured bacterium]
MLSCGPKDNVSNGEKKTLSSGDEDKSLTEKVSIVGKLGVFECDDYIQKYMTCVSQNVPEETKVMLLTALEQSKIQWKQALNNEIAKPYVSQSCIAALETVKQTMVQYNCAW